MPKLSKVHLENFRGFELLNMTPTGQVVRVTGPNGAGKTDLLLGTLIGMDPKAADGKVVTYGKDNGSSEVEVTLDSGARLNILRRWWTTKGGKQATEAVLKKIDGEDVTTYDDIRPILKKLVGPFIDVREILKVRTPAQERELGDALLKASGVSVSELDQQIAEALTARRDAKAASDAAKARFEAIPTPPPGLPEEEQSVAGRAAQIAEWRKERTRFEAHKSAVERLQGQSDDASAEVARLKQALAKAQEDAKRIAAETREAEIKLEEWAAVPSVEDIAEAEASLAGLEEVNQNVRQQAVWRELQEETETAGKDAEEAARRVEELRKQKTGLLTSAKLPIAGLTVTEEGSVVYNGVGLHELSEGQKMVVGVGIGIATIGGLKTLFVDGGESIDKKNEDIAIAMAEEAGVMLVIAETVKEAPSLVIRGAEYEAKRAEVAG